MAPKKIKQAAKQAAQAKEQPAATEKKPAQQPAKKDTPAKEPQKPAPVQTKAKQPAAKSNPVEAPKAPEPPAPSTVSQPASEPPKPQSKQSNLASQKPVEKKPSITLSERDKLELRKLKFSESGPGGNLEQAAKIREERLKKYGGVRNQSTDQLKKRAEKFGGSFVDKDQEKMLKQKRAEKFGAKGNTPTTDVLLSAEDQAKIDERKKRFGAKAETTGVVLDEDDETLKKRQQKYSGDGAPDKKVKSS